MLMIDLSMSWRSKGRLAMLALSSLAAIASHATIAIVNFDNLPTGPSTYAAAGPMQTINVPNVATFTGGVILGNATNFPAIKFATAPNTYASASPNVAGGDPSLSSTLDIAIDPAFTVSEVFLPVFNGMTSTQSYVVNAYDGANLVASQTLANIPSNALSGYGTADLLASNITHVSISPTDTTQGWDFLIDTVGFNTSAVPEPASMAALGIGAIGLLRRRKSARR